MVFRRIRITSANDVTGIGGETWQGIRRRSITKIQANITIKRNQSVSRKITVGRFHFITKKNQHSLRV